MDWSKKFFAFDSEMMSTMNEFTAKDYKLVRQEFDWVKENLFEEWDESGEWMPAVFHIPHDIVGRCDDENKIIWIHNHLLRTNKHGELRNLSELRVTLIHEICHAMTPTDKQHGEDWTHEMEMALDRLSSLYDFMDEYELTGEHYCSLHDSSDTVSTNLDDNQPQDFLDYLCFEVARYGGWTKGFFPKLTVLS